MDSKDYHHRNAISLESLRPAEATPDVVVDDDKKDVPIFSASAPPTVWNVPIDGAESQETAASSTRVDDAKLKRRARWALFVMAFFMGDVNDGLGPFLGVYLQEHGWAPGLRGTVQTVGGVATILATGPIGALIDATNHKRLLVAASAILVGVSQGLNLITTHPGLVFTTQIISAVAGSTLIPLLTALTLGICAEDPDDNESEADRKKKKHTFRSLNGRNQAANHAGNMVSAGLAGALGSRFGLTAIFYLVMAFCAALVACVFLLPERAIDHAAARGSGKKTDDGNNQLGKVTATSGTSGTEDEAERGGASPAKKSMIAKTRGYLGNALRLFVDNRSLIVVAATIFLFHLGNAAILFLYGQALVANGEGDPASTTGLTVIISQGAMVIVSVLTSWFAGRQGYWLSILISYVSLPVRSAIAGSILKSWGVWPVQILDGIGAGIQSVAIPGMLAAMMAGTGRVNLTISVVGGITRGTGGAISHSLGGWMAQEKGYSFALYLLGVFPIVSLVLWIGFVKILRPAMDKKTDVGKTS